MTFTLTITTSENYLNIAVTYFGIIPDNAITHNTWHSARALTFSLSASGNPLTSLQFDGFSINALNADDETATITDFNSNVVTARGATPLAGEIDGPNFNSTELFTTGGLTPLTESNIASWNLTVAQTGGGSQGIDNLQFTFTAIPEPSGLALMLFGAGMVSWLQRLRNSDT